jgi:hypothetical protein
VSCSVKPHPCLACIALHRVTAVTTTHTRRLPSGGGRAAEPVTKPALEPGALQHMLLDVGQTAAMASLLCAGAGWPYLADLCNALSKQAAAGGRHELLPLLEARARCGHFCCCPGCLR